MNLNLNIPFKGLDGVAVEGQPTQGKLLSQVLANHNKGNSVQLLEWAIELYNDRELVIDTTGHETLKVLIEGVDVLPALSKGQLLLSLKAAKDSV
jgi:hypothetical protein